MLSLGRAQMLSLCRSRSEQACHPLQRLTEFDRHGGAMLLAESQRWSIVGEPTLLLMPGAAPLQLCVQSNLAHVAVSRQWLPGFYCSNAAVCGPDTAPVHLLSESMQGSRV